MALVRLRRAGQPRGLAEVVDSSFRAVIAGSAVVVVAIVVLLAWLVGASRPDVARYEQGLSALQSGHTAMLDQETSLRGFVSTDDLAFMPAYQKARGDLNFANDKLLVMDGDQRLSVAVMNVRLAQQGWSSNWADLAARGQAPGRPGTEEQAAFLLSGKVLFDRYVDAQTTAVDLTTQSLDAQRHDQDVALLVAAGAAALTGLGTMAAAMVRRRRLRRDVLAPVTAVLDGLEAVREGRLDERISSHGPSELLDVVEGFNRMTGGLSQARMRADEREQHISAQSEKLRSILAMVREIGGSLKLDYVVDSVQSGVSRIIGADEVVIWITSPDGGTLVAADGARGSTRAPTVAVELGSGAVGRAAKYSRVVRECDEVRGCQRLTVPLVVGSRVVGVLDLTFADGAVLAEDQIEVLETLAVHAATALEAARLHEGAAHASEHDALTQLPNRRRLDADLQLECERSSRYDRPLAFVMLDLDHFKRINDELGHARGDEVLQGVADVITSTLRASDTAYRYGGEELALILRETDLEGALVLAERLRERIESVFGGEGEPGATASFGVVQLGEATRHPVSVVAAADAAMYQAKRAGRNRVCAAAAEPLPV